MSYAAQPKSFRTYQPSGVARTRSTPVEQQEPYPFQVDSVQASHPLSPSSSSTVLPHHMQDSFYNGRKPSFKNVAHGPQALPHVESANAGQEAVTNNFGLSEMPLLIEEAPAPDQHCYECVFSHSSLYQRRSSNRGLLWLRGPPGSGKSTLMKQLLQASLATESDSVCLCYFFRPSGQEPQASRLILHKAILHQLVSRFPQALKIMAKFEWIQTALPSTSVLWVAQEVFDELVRDVPRILKTHSLRICVDGIDHCGDDAAQKLVQDFAKLIEKPPRQKGEGGASHGTSIMFSSIEYPLEGPFPPSRVQMDDSNSEGVADYVRRQLHEAGLSVHDAALAKSGGSFLSARILITHVKLYDTLSPIVIEQSPVGVMSHPVLLEAIFQEMALRSGDRALSIEVELHFFQAVHTLHEVISSFFISNGLAILSQSQNISLKDGALVSQTHYFLATCCIRILVLAFREPGKHWHANANTTLELLRYARSTWPRHLTSASLGTRGASGILSLMEWPSQPILDGFVKFAQEDYTTLSIYPLYEDSTPGAMRTHLFAVYGQVQLLLVVSRKIGNAALNIQDAQGGTPLHLASLHGHSMVIKQLLKKSADSSIQAAEPCSGLDPEQPLADTAVFSAVIRESVESAKLLLDKVADTKLMDRLISSILQYAASTSKAGLVQQFRERGADLNAQDADGRTALHIAMRMNRGSIFRLLLDLGAQVDIPDNSGVTVFHEACKLGNRVYVQRLLENNAAIDCKDNGRQTALVYVVQGRHAGLAKMLLGTGVDINSADKLGFMVLMLAVQVCDKKLVMILLEKLPDLQWLSHENHTVVFYAVHREKGVSQLSKEQGVASLLFKRYAARCGVWHSEWKKCRQAFLAVYGQKQKPISKPKPRAPCKSTAAVAEVPKTGTVPSHRNVINTPTTPGTNGTTRSASGRNQESPSSQVVSKNRSKTQMATNNRLAQVPLCLVPGGYMSAQDRQQNSPAGLARVSVSGLGDHENPRPSLGKGQTIMRVQGDATVVSHGQSSGVGAKSDDLRQSWTSAGSAMTAQITQESYVPYSGNPQATSPTSSTQPAQCFKPSQPQISHPSDSALESGHQSAGHLNQSSSGQTWASYQVLDMQSGSTLRSNKGQSFLVRVKGIEKGLGVSPNPQSRPPQPSVASYQGERSIQKPMSVRTTVKMTWPPPGIGRKSSGGGIPSQPMLPGQSGPPTQQLVQQSLKQKAVDIGLNHPSGKNVPKSQGKPDMSLPPRTVQLSATPGGGVHEFGLSQTKTPPVRLYPNPGSMAAPGHITGHGQLPSIPGMPVKKPVPSSIHPLGHSPAGPLPGVKRSDQMLPGQPAKENRPNPLVASGQSRFPPVKMGRPSAPAIGKPVPRAIRDKKQFRGPLVVPILSTDLDYQAHIVIPELPGNTLTGGAGIATGAIGSYLLTSHVLEQRNMETHSSEIIHHWPPEDVQGPRELGGSQISSLVSSPVANSPSLGPSDSEPSDPELFDPGFQEDSDEHSEDGISDNGSQFDDNVDAWNTDSSGDGDYIEDRNQSEPEPEYSETDLEENFSENDENEPESPFSLNGYGDDDSPEQNIQQSDGSLTEDDDQDDIGQEEPDNSSSGEESDHGSSGGDSNAPEDPFQAADWEYNEEPEDDPQEYCSEGSQSVVHQHSGDEDEGDNSDGGEYEEGGYDGGYDEGSQEGYDEGDAYDEGCY
ncbi:hypothetical protein ACJZ2D_013250 [Fusarium nematophilum]